MGELARVLDMTPGIDEFAYYRGDRVISYANLESQRLRPSPDSRMIPVRAHISVVETLMDMKHARTADACMSNNDDTEMSNMLASTLKLDFR